MRVRVEREQGQTRAAAATSPRRQPRLSSYAVLQLSRTAGNRAVCRTLARRVLARQPEEDKEKVAATLFGTPGQPEPSEPKGEKEEKAEPPKPDARHIAKAFDLLATA